ncbi:MAG TPA: hypothetical protein VNI58_06850 [Mariprofundaceae bacterium]|nr:hypothetical protein [Mariprofundaceae bacterium]
MSTDTVVHALFYDSHPLSRLLLGMAVVVLLASGSVAILLAVSGAMVVMIDGGWRNVRRSLAVLRWLIVPIILLHLLLTGGERLWPQSGLPLSLDGLRTGAILSLNLLTFYIVAMLFSRLWRQEELLAYASKIPLAGRRMFPYLLAMPAVRGAVQGALQGYRRQFDLRRAWSQSGVLLASMLRHMSDVSIVCSQIVWLRWHAVLSAPRKQWSLRADMPVVVLAIALLGGAWLK